MRAILTIILFFNVFSSMATSIYTVPVVISAEKSFELGIMKIVGNSDGSESNWIILVYPEKLNQKENLSEVAVTLLSNENELVTTIVESQNTISKLFKRSDILFTKNENEIVKVSITYGSNTYIIPNVMVLKTIAYSDFELQYNKPLKQDK